jgi:GT2 family glycosyltransferase
MISIITAIHNGIEINKVFLSFLKKNTTNPFELIIIDNASTDGSAEFFEQNGALVVRNKENFSYPVSQNMGIKLSTTNDLFFLNNDIIVAPKWDEQLLQTSAVNQLEVVTACGIERIESLKKTKRIRKKWGVIKFLLNFLPYHSNKYVWMHALMYGNWNNFCQKRFSDFKNNVVEGFVGNTVFIKRSALEKIGLWDEQIQAADFDLYIRTKKRNLEVGDIKPCHIALGTFIHHFIRITVHNKPAQFVDAHNLISLEEKWGENQLKIYLADNLST